MNVNCAEFVPSARRETANRYQQSSSKPKFATRRSIAGICNVYDLSPSPQQRLQQQQPLFLQRRQHQQASAHWSLTQLFVWNPSTTIWHVLDGYDYDTVQQHFGSNGSHQQEQQDILGPGKIEGGGSANINNSSGGSVNSNQFTINHGQKSGHHGGKSSSSSTTGGATSSPKGRNSGGISKQRHNDNKTHPTHPWLVTTLKGHTDEIRDISFSSSGKFLATSAEENNTNVTTTAANNNTVITNDTISNQSSADNGEKINEDLATAYQIKEKIKKSATKSGRNRRQRKVNQQSNQNRQSSTLFGTNNMDIDEEGKENQQPSTPKSFRKQTKATVSILSNSKLLNQEKSTMINIDNLTKISRAVTPPLRQHTKLNLQESELVKYLRHYIINSDQLRMYGYPVESDVHTGCAEFYKHPPRAFGDTKLLSSFLSKKEALGKRDSGTWEDNNSDVIQLSGDSGRGSDSSSPPSVDSDSSENSEDDVAVSSNLHSTNESILQQFLYSSLEKTCSRCRSSFYVTDNGEYLTQEECVYHWGKSMQVYKPGHGFCSQYICCEQDISSQGCSKNRLHVWSGVSVGLNGPYEDYVRTQSLTDESVEDNNAKVYAMDCEMCFTGLGLEVAKVTVVGADGQLVYDQFVRPESEVVDYNTRFSGITEKDLMTKNCNVKSLRQIQQDLLQLFNAETILIGHALENDLRVLRVLHKNIIDTSIAFPHVSGFPFRRSLKNLTKSYLKRDIQVCENGHSSFEDSRACLELMLWRVRRDFRTVLEQ